LYETYYMSECASDQARMEILQSSRPKIRRIKRIQTQLSESTRTLTHVQNDTVDVKDETLKVVNVRPSLVKILRKLKISHDDTVADIPTREDRSSVSNAVVNDVPSEIFNSQQNDLAVPVYEYPVGEIFDITVSLALSPSYFVVRPNSSALMFEEFEINMLHFYSVERDSEVSKLELDAVKEGDVIVIFKADDNQWYRAKIHEILLSGSHFMVKLIDYGDLLMVEADNMRKLIGRFRELPAQAINARLSDIMSVNGDWSASDESWWEKKVEEKSFVGQVIDHWSVRDEKGLELRIYDTSTEDDVLIQEVVVQSGRAMYISTFF